jgi:hypothetical protein
VLRKQIADTVESSDAIDDARPTESGVIMYSHVMLNDS